MRFTTLLSALLSLLCISSCKKSAIAANEDVKALYERFHGKYKIVNVSSSEAVDLNGDGMASTNLLSEIDLENSLLEIRIGSEYVFIQTWPEVYLSPGVPDSVIHYANQGVSRYFAFDNAIQQLNVKPENPTVDEVRFPMPESVLIKQGDNIEVTINKRLYTSLGWKIIKVVTLYKRYTMIM
ncbi:hypothetical protein [Flavisolibacter ginsengisoli]|jgi:hypothetical protein|uniref:Uncharacterized protein n=1 Tax=Flavisolibacter ginsengisoli DSM 18119 TaxID=1121884 RepID=A0A1M5FIW1_9BACT|nr:hypothetical protein [Flavisolibacter ginsengisoli]SHF91435.1 hypothetical protein SAMN02745131_03843 [Flavisolibacter ginsengisoli DSM 18119]